jgi:hypothetical protein
MSLREQRHQTSPSSLLRRHFSRIVPPPPTLVKPSTTVDSGLGALAFATGSILMARPYVRHPGALFVAVPLSALAGMLLAGAAALIVAGAIALGESWDLDVVDLFAPSGRRRKRKREHRERFD